jgi:hypothetical protein
MKLRLGTVQEGVVESWTCSRSCRLYGESHLQEAHFCKIVASYCYEVSLRQGSALGSLMSRDAFRPG